VSAHRRRGRPQIVPPVQRVKGDGDLGAVRITGIWVHRAFEHLGGELAVSVEINGMWHAIGKWPPHGPISHIIEPAGILRAPLDELAHPGLVAE
jgi:hypothetical protein